MSLRSQGWSLARISRELDVPKTTLWAWDQQNRDQIDFLRHIHREALQENFVPSYEEELAQTRTYLKRIEAALDKQTFKFTDPQTLLRMSLQLRTRLARLRDDSTLPRQRSTGPAARQSPAQLAPENGTISPEFPNVRDSDTSLSTT